MQVQDSSDEEVYMSDISFQSRKKTSGNNDSVESYSRNHPDDSDKDDHLRFLNEEISNVSDISYDEELQNKPLRSSFSLDSEDSDLLEKTVGSNNNSKGPNTKKNKLNDLSVNSSDPFSDQNEIDFNLTFNLDDNPKKDPQQTNEILKEMVNIFKNSRGPESTLLQFPKIKQTKQIKNYCNILNDANIEFTTDLPLHLYCVYLLRTRNLNLPDPKFTLWPLPTGELIAPRSYLKTTTFESLGEGANDLLNSIKNSKYSLVNYKVNNKLSNCSNHMLEFWRPKINPIEDLNECIDAIFEKKINSQISNYSESKSKKLDKYGSLSNVKYERSIPEDINLNPLLKNKIVNKLDKIIDKIIKVHNDSKNGIRGLKKKLKRLNENSTLKVPNYGLDWINVLACLDNNDKQSKLLLMMLFNLKLNKDVINGPIDSYSADYELFAKAKFHRDKTLKKLFSKKRSNFKSSKVNPNYLKIMKRQKNHIQYNLDSFMNLDINTTEQKLTNEKDVIDKNNQNNGEI